MRLVTLLVTIVLAGVAPGCGETFGNNFLPGTVDGARNEVLDTGDASAPDAEDVVFEDVGPEDVVPEDVGPQDVVPEDIGPEDVGPDVPLTACDRWRAEYPERSTWVWRAGTEACATGDVDPVAIEDAVRRVNLYRALVGLPGIVNNAEFSRKAQLCAVLQNAMGTLNHTPPDTAPCYTPDGAEAAGASNLAMGARSPAAAVDLFVEDSGVASLRYRRWILYPPYRQGGFGTVGSFHCQWVFGWGVDPGVAFVGYPPPGEFPLQALRGAWSLSADGVSFSSAVVTVTRISDGTPLAIDPPWVAAPGYGDNTIAWQVRATVEPGSYRIRVTGGSRDFDYTTDLVDCR